TLTEFVLPRPWHDRMQRLTAGFSRGGSTFVMSAPHVFVISSRLACGRSRYSASNFCSSLDTPANSAWLRHDTSTLQLRTRASPSNHPGSPPPLHGSALNALCSPGTCTV